MVVISDETRAAPAPGATSREILMPLIPGKNHDDPLQNQLLAAMPADVLARFAPELTPVHLALGPRSDGAVESGDLLVRSCLRRNRGHGMDDSRGPYTGDGRATLGWSGP